MDNINKDIKPNKIVIKWVVVQSITSNYIVIYEQMNVIFNINNAVSFSVVDGITIIPPKNIISLVTSISHDLEAVKNRMALHTNSTFRVVFLNGIDLVCNSFEELIARLNTLNNKLNK